MSVGLFGAYTGNPRIQRAYATSNAPCVPNASPAYDDTTFRAALVDPAVTCIEIDGVVQLLSNLPVVDNSMWIGGPRRTEGLTIFGQGADDVIDGGNTFSGFNFELSGSPLNADAELFFTDLTFSNLVAPNYGGALYAYMFGQAADLHIDLTNVTVENCGANVGGAIYASSWDSNVYVSVMSSRFESNAATDSNFARGGAIRVYSEDDTASLALTSATFVGNHASGGGAVGGAVSVDNSLGQSIVTVDGASHFDQNFAHALGVNREAYGGAIFVDGSIHVSGTPDTPIMFTDDTAVFGGAIYSKDGGEIAGASFEGNVAGNGGAILSYGTGRLHIRDSTFTGNYASDVRGGAISTTLDVEMTRTSVVENYAAEHGGGIFIWEGGSLILENSFVGGNVAGGSAPGIGGAIYMDPVGGDAPLELIFSTVYDDTVRGGGTGPAEILAHDVTSVMSVVGNGGTGNVLDLRGSLDDSFSVSTSSLDDSVFEGPGSENVAPGSLRFGPLDGDLPGTLGRMPEADSVLALAAGPSPLGFAPADSPFPSISRDQLDVQREAPFTIGARQYPWPTPPTPPTPAPATPASPPREVTAVASVQSAEVSWVAPASTGSFPVTTYQVTSSPGGHGCLVAAPALTCTITGLTAGESYTFVAKALTGAGWSSSSAPSNAVVPEGPPAVKAILITSSRDRAQPSMARVDGSTTGLVGADVTPFVRKAGQVKFTPGTNVRTVDADGRFTWQRKLGKKFTVYFTAGDVGSNRLVVRPASS